MGTRTSSDIFTNLSQLLPTGQFLAFQAIAPLFTNNGLCRTPERIVTGVLLTLFFIGCFGMSFIDSITTDNGKVYYGLVTPWGLYNKQFKKAKIAGDLFEGDAFFTGGDDLEDSYKLQFTDFVNGVLNVISFGVLSCLAPPITTCYYPGIPDIYVKTGPIIAAIFVGALFALFPSGRHGVGFAQTESKVGLVPEAKATIANNTNDCTDNTTLLINSATTILDVHPTVNSTADKETQNSTDKVTTKNEP